MEFWKERRESTTQRAIGAPATTGDIAIAQELMRQLGAVGEIGQIERSRAGDHIKFQVTKPGVTLQLDADLRASRASIKETRVNAVGVLDALHRFTGVRMDDPGETRDWILTRIWSFAMDALAVGLGLMVLTGIFMWYRLEKKRRSGLVALGLGTVCCALFVVGLARFF